MKKILLILFSILLFTDISIGQKDSNKKFKVDFSAGIGYPLLTGYEGEAFALPGIHCDMTFIYKPKIHGGFELYIGVTRNPVNTNSYATSRGMDDVSSAPYYTYETMFGYSYFSGSSKNLSWHIKFLIGLATVKVPSLNETFVFNNVGKNYTYSSVTGSSLALGASTGLKYQFSTHWGALFDLSYTTATLLFDPSVITFLGGGVDFKGDTMKYTTYLDLLQGTLGLEYSF